METENTLSGSTFRDETHAEKGTVFPRRSTRKRRIIIFLVVTLLNIGLLALLASQVLVPAQNQSNAGSSPLIGHPAPDFTLGVLSPHAATALHLASFKGKPVMLNFWASWCDPCKHEAPLLEATWQRVQSQGVVFIGVDYEDTQTDGLSFLNTYRVTYSNVVDTSGATAISYGVTGVPETVFIDRHGIIVQKVIGELSEQTLKRNLQLLSS
jgi:cytochrome c biogenesis protein CcmG, thiol:disulfide interchange protein DsbE